MSDIPKFGTLEWHRWQRRFLDDVSSVISGNMAFRQIHEGHWHDVLCNGIVHRIAYGGRNRRMHGDLAGQINPNRAEFKCDCCKYAEKSLNP